MSVEHRSLNRFAIHVINVLGIANSPTKCYLLHRFLHLIHDHEWISEDEVAQYIEICAKSIRSNVARHDGTDPSKDFIKGVDYKIVE